MDPGSPGLEDLGFLDLFGSQDKQTSMDLDTGLNGISLSELDVGGLALNMQPSLRGYPGHDVVSAALRSQPDTGAAPLTVSDNDIRPSVPTEHASSNTAPSMSAQAPAPAAAPLVAPAPAQYSIKPMPARKTVTVKPVVVVKAEVVEPAPQPPQPPQPVRQSTLAQTKQQLQQLQEEADAAAFDSDSDPSSSAHGGSKRRRRIRNAKQQELNRLAQQRYRERRKQKYSNLQETVDELSTRLCQLNTLEAANSELQQRNGQLEVVVKEQNAQLQVQKDTITRQAQQLQTQALQLSAQAKQLHVQVSVIQQQDKTLQELRSKLGEADASSSSGNNAAAAAPGTPAAAGSDADQLNDQIALAVRAVLTGVSSMASVSMPPAKDAVQMQQMVGQLPDALLQQIRSCCREVALHLKKTEVKEQPHAISVPCC